MRVGEKQNVAGKTGLFLRFPFLRLLKQDVVLCPNFVQTIEGLSETTAKMAKHWAR